jgi:hypothetical protein
VSVEQLRVGTLLVMALQPGTGEGEASQQARELLDPDPQPVPTPAKRQPKASAAVRFVGYFFKDEMPEPLGVGVVRLTVVNVRSGPSCLYPSTNTLDGRTRVQVWAECEGWLLISEMDGGRPVAGWVGCETIKMEGRDA